MLSNVHISQIKVGDRVKVRTWGDEIVSGTVEAVLSDVKNGTPGIDYVADGAERRTGFSNWCYIDQVVSVTPKAV